MASGKSAILSVRIVSDATNAQQGLNQTAAAAQNFEDKVTQSGKAANAASADYDHAASSAVSFEKGLNMASVGAAGLLTAFGAAGKAAEASASQFQQAYGAVQAVFGAAAEQVNQVAENAATSVGLASSQYDQMAAILGSELKNLGVAESDLAPETERLISLGADLAAVYGGTTVDAVEALSAALRGETDPLEEYGVMINQSEIATQEAAMGLSGLTGQAQRNAQATATLALIYKQTGDVQGQFSAQTNTAAEATQVASASFENAKASLGEALLPVVTKAAGAFADLANWVSQNSTLFLVLVGILATVSGGVLAINMAYTTFTATTKALEMAQAALDLVMDANPFVLVGVAVAALAADFVLAYQKCDSFRALVDGVVQDIGGAWNWLDTEVTGVFSDIGQWATSTIDDITSTWDAGVSAIEGFFSDLGDDISGIFDDITGWASEAIDWVKNLFSFQAPSWMTDAVSWMGFKSPRPPKPPAGGNGGDDDPGVVPLTARVIEVPVALRVGAPRQTGQQETQTITITVNGALDPMAVGRQIDQILQKYLRSSGQTKIQVIG